MPWLTILLTASGTAALMAGGAQLRLWRADRSSTERLLFFIASLGVTATTLLELRLLRTATPAEFAEILRWMHVPTGVAIVAFAWFTVSYLRAGPTWLAWLYTLARTVILVLNFTGPGSATFLEVTAVRPVEFMGETVAVAVGVESPWRALVTGSELLFVILIVVATGSAYRSRTRERPLAFGGAVLTTIVLASLLSDAGVRGGLPGPLPTLGFVAFLLVAYMELSRDLARSVKNARDLATARRRMERAAEAARITLWELDTETGRLWTYQDGASDEARGVSTPTALADFLGTVHAEDRDRIRTGISTALESGGQIDEVYRLADSREGTRWMALVGSVDRGPETDARLIRGAVRDITERREAEAELESQRDAMARAERTMTLGHLSAGLAHELRHPLGSIMRDVDTAEILLDRSGAESADLRAVVSDLRAGVDRANGVLSRIHDFSTVRPASFGPVDLRSVVEQTAAFVRAEAVRDSIGLEMSLEADLSPVHGDAVLLQQVLVNLLLNAFEAVRGVAPADRKVSVRVARHGAGRQIVEVSDSGPGIPNEVAERIFDPFYTTTPGGSGMGLWIARSIIERHGGDLDVSCQAPGGTTFRIVLDSAEAHTGG